METVQQQFEALAERAVGFAKAFEKDFDYSEESITDLEEILDYYYRDLTRKQPEDRQVWNMSMVWGAYLGETMLRCGGREAGYGWAVADGKPILRKVNVWELSPVGKVEKRLRKGAEESIRSFYQMGMLIIEGKLTIT